MPDLLRYAQTTENPTWRTLAFRGFVRLSRQSPLSTVERLQRLDDAAQLAASAEEKLLVISSLAEVPHPAVLQRLESYLEDPALTDASALAILKAGSNLDVQYKDELIPVLQKVLKHCRNADVQKQTKSLLTKLGSVTD